MRGAHKSNAPLQSLCYYARVAMICKNDEMLGEWNALFTNGFEGFSDVERAFKEAFGEALLEANPSLSGLVAQAGAAIEDRATTSTTGATSAARPRSRRR